MKKRPAIALAVSLNLAVAGYATGADSSECIIDEMMEQNRIAMDKMAVGIYEANVTKPMEQAIEAAPTVKEASCLPILDTLDGLMRLRLPSFGAIAGGLMAKLRSMACKMANDFLADLKNRASFNISDPLGVASVSIGATNENGGVEVERYDMTKVIQDAATKAVTDKVKQEARKLTNESSKAIRDLPMGPQNRAPRVENAVNSDIKEAINGL